MDARFVLVEIGKLGSKVDRLIEDTKAVCDKVDAISHQITFVKGAVWVIGALLTVVVGAAVWYLSGRLSITIRPPP